MRGRPRLPEAIGLGARRHDRIALMSLLPSIDESLVRLVRVGAAHLDGLTVRESDETLAREVADVCADLRRRHGQLSIGDVPGVGEARALYKGLGIDPTKHRPSSEALLRRALRDQPLARINTLVDVVNLCSLRQQLPYGLYDAANVRPPTILRRGWEGEGYEGIRKARVNLGGRPALIDAEGPFGNPTSDSARTMVTVATISALLVVYAPGAFAPTRVETLLGEAVEAVRRLCGGRVLAQAVLPVTP
jgi:DNA/RNA-binding domain of Phe-tRNA-synthetase-like protein